jgi:hypothetical protein
MRGGWCHRLRSCAFHTPGAGPRRALSRAARLHAAARALAPLPWRRRRRWAQHRIREAEVRRLPALAPELGEATGNHGQHHGDERHAGDVGPSDPFPHVT